MTDIAKIVLDSYFDDQTDLGRFTSQDICDNVRETIALTPAEVTEYLIGKGYSLDRQLDRLVWVKV